MIDDRDEDWRAEREADEMGPFECAARGQPFPHPGGRPRAPALQFLCDIWGIDVRTLPPFSRALCLPEGLGVMIDMWGYSQAWEPMAFTLLDLTGKPLIEYDPAVPGTTPFWMYSLPITADQTKRLMSLLVADPPPPAAEEVAP